MHTHHAFLDALGLLASQAALTALSCMATCKGTARPCLSRCISSTTTPACMRQSVLVGAFPFTALGSASLLIIVGEPHLHRAHFPAPITCLHSHTYVYYATPHAQQLPTSVTCLPLHCTANNVKHNLYINIVLSKENKINFNVPTHVCCSTCRGPQAFLASQEVCRNVQLCAATHCVHFKLPLTAHAKQTGGVSVCHVLAVLYLSMSLHLLGWQACRQHCETHGLASL